MTRYLLRRILNMIPVLFLATVISFAIMHAAPGGPENVLLANSSEDLSIDASKLDQLRAKWGLDQPIYIQYERWLGNLARGDFGMSYFQSRPVAAIIKEALPNTLRMSVMVMFLSYAIALPLGIISAVRQYSMLDYAVTGVAFVGQAAPSYWVGMMLMYAVAMKSHGLIPTNGFSTPGINLDTYGWLSVLGDRLKYMLLPVAVSTFSGLTMLTRYMRSSMLEVLRDDYVRTARAKGLPEKRVIYKHALRNALLPIVTLSGGILAHLVSGSVIIETIFSWPGIGLVAIDAVNQRDYPVSMAILVITAVMLMIGYLIVDFAYVLVDPRIKYD